MRSLIATCSVLLLAGCFSSSDGEALQRDVAELKRQVSAQSGKAETKRLQLQKVMEQATALLTRNSADVGAQIERIQNQNNKLNGQIEELRQSNATLNQKIDQLQAKVEVNSEKSDANAAPQTQDKDSLFRKGRDLHTSGDHAKSRQMLRQFISRFGDDSRTAVAQRMIGDSYYVQQKFAPAIIEYRKILEKHKKSSAAADAMYKIGMSFYQLKFCTDAKGFLQQLIRKNRRHKDVKNAKKLLKLIRRYRRNRAFCRS